MKDLCCDVFSPDEKNVTLINSKIPDTSKLERLALFFKAFSDLSRIKILTALNQGELCVCDLCEIAQSTQSAVSHQLKYLTALDIVKRRRVGKYVFYSLKDDHVHTLLATALTHIDCTNQED